MENNTKIFLGLIALLAVISIFVFTLQGREALLFVGIMVLTLVLMAKIPGKVHGVLLRRLEKKAGGSEELEEWKAEAKKKSMDYSISLIGFIRKFLFWGIFLAGLTSAVIWGQFDISEEVGLYGFQVSLISLLRFLWIVLFTVFLSKIVPTLLIKTLTHFISQLKTFRIREKKKDVDEVEGGKEKDIEQPEETDEEEGVEAKEMKLPEKTDEEEEDEEPDTETKKEGTTENVEALIQSFVRYTILIIGLVYAIAGLGLDLGSSLDILGTDITIMSLVNAILAGLITVILVIYFLPAVVNTIINVSLQIYAKRHETEEERVTRLNLEVEKIKPSLHKIPMYLFVLMGILTVLGNFPSEFLSSSLQPLRIIIRALIILTFAFLFTTLIPLFIFAYSTAKKNVKKTHLYQAGRYINYLILLIALFLVMNVLDLKLSTYLTIGGTCITLWSIISAIVVIMVTLVVSKMVIAMLKDTVLSPDLIDKHASAVLEKMIHITIVLIGLFIALGILGLNLFAIVTGLGLIGFALAFGMQDTIANFVAGIIIAIERPYRIGDRIQVGNEEEGDVMDIGLRSTKIRTTTNETVLIPNNLMVTSEVWNLTKDSPTIILRVPIGISYDSDWHHAEKIILDVASKHPEAVPGDPPTHVRMIQYGDSSIDLQLRIWISNARKRPTVKSDILKAVKDRFDEEGIEIPFPYRTIVFKKDTEAEAKAAGTRAAEDTVKSSGLTPSASMPEPESAPPETEKTAEKEKEEGSKKKKTGGRKRKKGE